MRRKIVLIILDGCRPDGLAQADTPNIDALCRAGAYTWTAQSVRPSISLPTHMSMFRGVPPEKHGVTDNVSTPSAALYPSVVDVARKAGRHTAMFYDWEVLRDLNAPGSLNLSYYRAYRHGAGEATGAVVTDMAAAYLAAEQPDLCVIYMGNIDEIGHKYGWMSPQYLEAIAQGDRAVGKVLAALDGGGVRDQYALLIQADHGGHERDHAAGLPEDLTIPWILSGPGVKQNHRIQTPVRIYDTAPTIAHLLDLPRPDLWEGQPIHDALA